MRFLGSRLPIFPRSANFVFNFFFQKVIEENKKRSSRSISRRDALLGYINIFYLELTRGARKQRERMWALTDYTTIFSFSHTLLQFFCLFSFSSIYRSSFPSIFLLNRRTIIFFFASIKRQQNAASKKLLLHILMQKWLKTLLQGT